MNGSWTQPQKQNRSQNSVDGRWVWQDQEDEAHRKEEELKEKLDKDG